MPKGKPAEPAAEEEEQQLKLVYVDSSGEEIVDEETKAKRAPKSRKAKESWLSNMKRTPGGRRGANTPATPQSTGPSTSTPKSNAKSSATRPRSGRKSAKSGLFTPNKNEPSGPVKNPFGSSNLLEKLKKEKEKVTGRTRSRKINLKQQDGYRSDTDDEEAVTSTSSKKAVEMDTSVEHQEADSTTKETPKRRGAAKGKKETKKASRAVEEEEVEPGDEAAKRERFLAAAIETMTRNVRTSLRAVFEGKDEKTQENSLISLSRAFDKACEDGLEVKEGMYKELEHQLTNMALTKKNTDSRYRILRLIANLAVRNIKEFTDDELFNNLMFYLSNELRVLEEFPRVCAISFLEYLLEASLRSDDKDKPKKKKKKKDPWLINSKHGEEDANHILALKHRRDIYRLIKEHYLDACAEVRCAIVRACSVIQDDEIPNSFVEAVELSPKDIILRCVRDISPDVRSLAMKQLKASIGEQIEGILESTRRDRNDKVRYCSLVQLGQLSIDLFSIEQRHFVLCLLSDYLIGEQVAEKVLAEWMKNMLRNMEKAAMKKAKGADAIKPTMLSIPFELLDYIDCSKKECADILMAALKVSRDSFGEDCPMAEWMHNTIDALQGKIITADDFDVISSDSTPIHELYRLLLFWSVMLEFIVKNALDEMDRDKALKMVSPSMGTIADCATGFLRVQKKLPEGEVDASLVEEVLSMLLESLHHLDQTDSLGMDQWNGLLVSLLRRELIQLSVDLTDRVISDFVLIFNNNQPDVAFSLVHDLLPAIPSRNADEVSLIRLKYLRGLLRTAKYRSRLDIFELKNMLDDEAHPLMSSASLPLRRLAVECVGLMATLDVEYSNMRTPDIMALFYEETDRELKNICLSLVGDQVVAHGMAKISVWLALDERTKHEKLIKVVEQDLSLVDDMDTIFNATRIAAKLFIHETTLSEGTRCMSLMAYRLFHPSALCHRLLRSCIVEFFRVYGGQGRHHQMNLCDAVIDMVYILNNRMYKEIVNYDQPARAFQLIIGVAAPSKQQNANSTLASPHGKFSSSHIGLLRQLLDLLEKCMDERYIRDILAEVVLSCELTGMTEPVLNSIYSKAFQLYDDIKVVDSVRCHAAKCIKTLIKNLESAKKSLQKHIDTAEAEGRLLNNEDYMVPVQQGRTKKPATIVRKKPTTKATKTPLPTKKKANATPATAKSESRLHLARNARKRAPETPSA